MSRLQFTTFDGERLDLDDGMIRLVGLEGTGMPGTRHQSVRVPNRHGEVYTGRTLYDTRFLDAEIVIAVPRWADEAEVRRRLARALAPTRREGTLRYWADPDVQAYEITALAESTPAYRGLTNGLLRRAVISFRCPDPLWRSAEEELLTLTTTPGGLVIPLVIPLVISSGSVSGIATNTGDEIAYPEITITWLTAGTNPVVANDTLGLRYEIIGTFAASDIIVIDFNTPRADLNDEVSLFPQVAPGSAIWGLAPSSTVPNGANTLIVGPATGSARFDIRWHQRYIGV